MKNVLYQKSLKTQWFHGGLNDQDDDSLLQTNLGKGRPGWFRSGEL